MSPWVVAYLRDRGQDPAEMAAACRQLGISDDEYEAALRALLSTSHITADVTTDAPRAWWRR